MDKELHVFLSADHERLDALLATCLRGTGNRDAYDAFRRGLLRHIAIEERVLFPLLRAHQGITPLQEQLHSDHAALAALLVPPPTGTELEQIAAILQAHNSLEEDAGGLYDMLETIAADQLAPLMSSVHAVAAVRVVPNADSAIARSSIAQLVRSADEGRRRFRK